MSENDETQPRRRRSAWYRAGHRAEEVPLPEPPYIPLKVLLLVVFGAYTAAQGAVLIVPEVVPWGTTDVPANAAEARAYSFGARCGSIAGLLLGTAACGLLARSLRARTDRGPRHRGFAFLWRAALAIVLGLSGGMLIAAGLEPPRRPGDIKLRAGGVAMTVGAAGMMVVALGRKGGHRRVLAQLVEDEDPSAGSVE